jgi:hypothetical protein
MATGLVSPRFWWAFVAACALPGTTACAQEPAQGLGHRPVTYFIAAESAEAGSRPGDRDLALQALEAWARLAQPDVALAPASEESATLRLYWVPAGAGLYGEMRARAIDGSFAADVFVHPDTDALGLDIALAAREDPLFRDTVVYLTCVHEIGHAFGLPHTASSADIMYSFVYGGDFVAYFRRFRDRLGTRADIPGVSPFSDGDVAAFRALR